MSTSTSQDLRCPRCGAHVRAGSDWCTLCYTDLRPAPAAPEPAAVEAPPAEAHPADVHPADVHPAAVHPADVHPADVHPADVHTADPPPAAEPGVRRGKHARREPSEADVVDVAAVAAPLTGPEVEARAQALLAELAAAESGNPLGPLANLLDSPGKKVALTVGGATVAAAVLLLLMWVLGAIV